MEGVNKWFIAFLILLGLAVPSFLISSDVNAYKFELEYLPYTRPEAAVNNGMNFGNSAFTFRGKTSSGSDATLKNIGYVTIPYFNESSGRCEYSTYSFARPQIDLYSIPYRLQPPQNYSGPTPPDFNRCYTDKALDSSDVQSLSSTILNEINFPVGDTLLTYLPYRYNFNGAFLRSTEDTDGLVRSSKLDFSELFEDGQFPSTVSRLYIPVGFSSQTFVPGDHIEFSGSFYLDSEDLSSFTLNPDYHARLESYFTDYNNYFDNFGVSKQVISDCTLSYTSNSNSFESPHILSYNCSVDVPSVSGFSEFSLSYFILKFDGYDYLWTLPNAYSMIYDSSIVITNYDETPANISFQDFEILGNVSSDKIPGYVGSLPSSGSCASDDWLCNLSHLFSFNFINPFTPIFGLFADNDSCVNIPTVAGMIHSDEQTVCPWFDSSTRNIVTPVLGIASMMLLFGFVVRWLGARSGNFFEDSTQGNDFGSIHIGRRFKK